MKFHGKPPLIVEYAMPHPLLPQTISLLSRLASHNTQTARPNLELVEEVRAYLRQQELEAEVALDDSGQKATLLCTIGPKVDGGVVLSGHTDVVDALGQTWQSPPFELVERDNRLYARGACDMKGFIACVLAQAPAFAAARLKAPVHIALSRDEEIGSVGMPQMLEMIRASALAPMAAIVGEPTEMKIVAGHKAGYEMLTIFHGVAAHSSMPRAGTSATVPAARFAVFLAELSDEMSRAPAAGSPFEPPHGIINVGILRGGTGKNIVADRCVVDWHYRPLPGDDVEQVIGRARRYAMDTLLPQMRAGGHPAEIEFLTESSYPGLLPQEDSPALQLARQLTGERDYGVAPFGADSGYFQEAGIPAVLLGPGSIAQAHKPDEYIEIAQLSQCLDFLDALRARLAA